MQALLAGVFTHEAVLYVGGLSGNVSMLGGNITARLVHLKHLPWRRALCVQAQYAVLLAQKVEFTPLQPSYASSSTGKLTHGL